MKITPESMKEENDSYSRNIMDRLEINYELVEKVIMDIKKLSINNPLKNKESGDWYYYCYEKLTDIELKHISKFLYQLYNIKTIDTCLSYNLFNRPHVSFKFHLES